MLSMLPQRLGLIIGSELHADIGKNICGPCCISVPEWVAGKLGKFYLYFADHQGQVIKLAYADEITGPWKVHSCGVLSLKRFNDAYDHVASPDIYIDHSAQRLRLYFHARSRSRGREQWSFSAISNDGIHFAPEADYPLAPFYLKVFCFDGFFYGITKGGRIWRSEDGVKPFLGGNNILHSSNPTDLWHNYHGAARHFGLHQWNESLDVYFTRIGDRPERILKGNVKLAEGSWLDWKCKDIVEVLRPELGYEGAHVALTESTSGPSMQIENALRDPDILQVGEELFMFYADIEL